MLPPRLAQLRVYIEKIRPIDKQLSYQVDKLLRATAKVQASADVDAAAGQQQQQQQAEGAAVGGGDDALQYRPNPKALLSKVPLVGDTTGGCSSSSNNSSNSSNSSNSRGVRWERTGRGGVFGFIKGATRVTTRNFNPNPLTGPMGRCIAALLPIGSQLLDCSTVFSSLAVLCMVV